ncbi:hypothetical protein EVAR_48461_1 [Eumeta japonica]|uniref:Uncharacterized protein n=1 Tax=Eumeta variegata TaxID=151549 RepID=A0A4C1XFT8_EUMVA|nr:hypothetical protein EVAR_48461_1 [Eumeta japonica]
MAHSPAPDILLLLKRSVINTSQKMIAYDRSIRVTLAAMSSDDNPPLMKHGARTKGRSRPPEQTRRTARGGGRRLKVQSKS